MQITDEHQHQITAFIANPQMTEAVLAVLMPTDEDFAADVPTDLNDADYGRAVKVWRGARALLQKRYDELQRIASRNPHTAPTNQAR